MSLGDAMLESAYSVMPYQKLLMELETKINRKWDNDDRTKLIKETNKIVDPVKNNLDINPFKTLHKHNE